MVRDENALLVELVKFNQKSRSWEKTLPCFKILEEYFDETSPLSEEREREKSAFRLPNDGKRSKRVNC